MPFIIAFGLITLLFVPSIVAAARRHPQAGRIFLVNLLGGWTILGWISALIWALRPPEKR